MLTLDESTILGSAARSGETGVGIRFMRHLARVGRIEEIAEVIQVFYEGAEVNKSPLRAFLAHRVPGILVNHYFPGSTHYDRFISWTLADGDWEKRIIAAAPSPERLALEVARIKQAAEAGVHNPAAQE